MDLEERPCGERRFCCFADLRAVVWTFLAWWVGKPAFLPSPAKTLDGAIELISNGELQTTCRGQLYAHHRRLR